MNGIHSLKEHNESAVLRTLMTMNTATRGQLAQRTGLSQPTVNAIVQELEDKGIVQPGNFAVSAGGRRPQCYTLRTNHMRATTIRVLSKSLEYLVVTIDGTVILRNSWPITATDNVVDALQALLTTLTRQDNNIRVVSIGVPGVVGPGGVLHAIPQIQELEGVSLVRELDTYVDIPIYVENDMNSVALGSVVTEPGQETAKDMVFVHIGEGVGAGIVVGGQIIRGFSSFAGEIKYIFKPLEPKKSQNSINNEETLEYLLAQTSNTAKRAKLLSNIIISIICLLNPPIILFGSKYANEEILWNLRHECENHLPLWTLPTFKLMTEAEEETAYNKGLKALVDDVLINQITSALYSK